MEFWLYRVCLWVILFIMEIFVGTLDFLAIGIAALITWAASYLFGIDFTEWKIAAIIFALASILSIMVTRILILPNVRGKDGPEPMSGEAVLWKQLVVQNVNNRLVVRYEGNYWNIDSKDSIQVEDTVEVIKMQDNRLVVKKVV